MAKSDAYRPPSGMGYLVDCQANLLNNLNTRVVVPIFPAAEAERGAPRLNPILDVCGEPHVMVTQFAGSMPIRQLGERVTSLIEHNLAIDNAIDMLLNGY